MTDVDDEEAATVDVGTGSSAATTTSVVIERRFKVFSLAANIVSLYAAEARDSKID